jgi:hypothetical protein
MYLTFWPVVVLSSHALAPAAVRRAVKGVKKLFVGNQILVAQSVSREMMPYENPVLVSCRHTMCGALLLQRDQPQNRITRSVLNLMLDKRNGWQNPDGGWAHSNHGVTSSDLWGSAYALSLLDAAFTGEFLGEDVQELVREAIERTLSYLEAEWKENRWQYGKATFQENVVLVAVEIAPLLARWRPTLHRAVSEQLLEWLGPGGDIAETYFATVPDVPRVRLCSRMAYALFRAGVEKQAWLPLFEAIGESNLDPLISAELAFVLDLSFEG